MRPAKQKGNENMKITRTEAVIVGLLAGLVLGLAAVYAAQWIVGIAR
jgi:hypothetical protein